MTAAAPNSKTPLQAARRMAASAMRDGFQFQALHEFNGAAGQPLHWRIRLKHPGTGEKWIRPMQRFGDGFKAGEPKYPDGKPLYRLHELVARHDDLVIVTEGEFKADKLAALGLLVTTSGAADSAGKTNWQALASRAVLIWPDNDEAGQRYAAAVQAALAPLGCTVQKIDVAVLGLPIKGDAADWLAAHSHATAADVLALARECQPDAEPQGSDAGGDGQPLALARASATTAKADPNTCKYGGGLFKLTEQGVLFVGQDDDGNDKAPVWICSPIGVMAKTRDAKSGEWGRLLEWFDDDRVSHQWAMPLELLEGDGIDFRRELARLGLHIGTSRQARDLLAAYVKVWPVQQRARCVDRLGWHGTVFATPAQTIGEADELVVFQNAHAIEPALRVAGTVDDWRSTVAALATGNTRLVFALSLAFAGTLANLVGEDSGGFHLRGKSSSGKSTALKVAASVWGEPSAYVRLWRATANGLEGLAALHNDSLLILDELSQCDPKEAGESAYLLANGQGKARAARNGTARAAQRWRVLFLSAGEESLSTLMSRAGRKANAGQEIRLADFDADAGAGMGILEALHDHPSPAALVHAIKDAAARSHGAVGLAWLRQVVLHHALLADLIVGGIKQFVTEVMPAGATGQIERVARRFALVAVAGELATHYGLTGWPQGEAESSVKACFAAWLESFGGVGNKEERGLLAQVRAFFESHGASRFEDVSARDDQRIINRAGFYRTDVLGVRQYMVLTEAFKRDVCGGLDDRAAAKVLVAQGWIAPGGDGRPTQKQRLPGMAATTRVYVFTSKALEGGE